MLINYAKEHEQSEEVGGGVDLYFAVFDNTSFYLLRPGIVYFEIV